jgi:outer membrane protein assembly factor BamB
VLDRHLHHLPPTPAQRVTLKAKIETDLTESYYAVDAGTGGQRWKFRTDDVVSSSPIVAGGVVYVGSVDNNLYAVDAATGEQRWSFRTAGALWEDPAVADGVVYIVCGSVGLYAVTL